MDETPGFEPTHPLVEPSLFYDPPYERPLEDEFAWHLVKYLSPISALGYQTAVPTPCGRFWIDFVVEHGARRIGFECGDLEEGPEGDDVHLRDALLVGSGAVDVLYRFRGGDLLHRLHDCLHLVALWEGGLFSKRGRINLTTLASAEARACRVGPADAVVRVPYRRPEEEGVHEGEAFTWPGGAAAELVVRRLSREQPAAWVRDYDRALAHYGVSADDLGEQWAKSA